MNKDRHFSNQPMRWLQANHPELMTASGAIDGSKGKTAQHVVKHTTKLLVEAGVLPGDTQRIAGGNR
ncbi:MAG TPA: hypothetical protein PKD12_15605 [Nitrospira sp.]|nr:hypothetical protein [Nitrospira sp.]